MIGHSVWKNVATTDLGIKEVVGEIERIWVSIIFLKILIKVGLFFHYKRKSRQMLVELSHCFLALFCALSTCLDETSPARSKTVSVPTPHPTESAPCFPLCCIHIQEDF